MYFQNIYQWLFGSKRLTKPIVVSPKVINKAPTPYFPPPSTPPYFPHPSPPPRS